MYVRTTMVLLSSANCFSIRQAKTDCARRAAADIFLIKMQIGREFQCCSPCSRRLMREAARRWTHCRLACALNNKSGSTLPVGDARDEFSA